MSKEKGEELFRALNVILDAVSSLNLRIWRLRRKLIEGSLQARLQPNLQKEKIRLLNPTRRIFRLTPFLSLPCLADLVLLRSLGLLRRQRLLLVLVRPLFALLVMVAAMDVVVVLVVPLVVPLAVPLAVPDRAPVLAGAPAPAAATMAVAMAVVLKVVLEVALEVAPAALNSHPRRTTRRPSSWECGTTAPPTWLVRTLNNKPSLAPQWRRSKLRRWSRSTCVCRRRSER
jgi:hypothetical protein